MPEIPCLYLYMTFFHKKKIQNLFRCMEIGRTGRVQVEDIVFLVRKDPRKYARVKDLLTMNEELKRARKAFDEIKFAGNIK
jgi:transcription initiation factor TFIID subunit 13